MTSFYFVQEMSLIIIKSVKQLDDGGLVIEPKRGLYRNLKVVDVVSLHLSLAVYPLVFLSPSFILSLRQYFL
jgi:hypothetical protein